MPVLRRAMQLRKPANGEIEAIFFSPYLTAADDGYSGTTFDRPAFREMEAMAENGEIATIVVKDYCAIIGLNQKDLENQGILA